MKQIILALFALCLTQALVNVNPLDDFYKKWIPNLKFSVESGYVEQKQDDVINQMFYQLTYMDGYNKQTIVKNAPLIIWLQGGPGCGSSPGLYYEIGPFIVSNSTEKDTYDIKLREFSWNKLGSLLFVDQPFGAGFSYSTSPDYVNSTEEAATTFVQFFQEFLQSHQELKDAPIYIFGESYAGHYIPAFARKLVDQQDYMVNFRGVGIGDGLTDSYYQVATYMSYLYSNGLIDDLTRNKGIVIEGLVQNLILQNKISEASHNQDIIIEDLGASLTKISVYNFHQYDESSGLVDPYEAFLKQNKNAFKVPEFVDGMGCNNTIYQVFAADIPKSFSQDVAYLINKGQVLLYNGQLDFIINTPGALQWINKLNWDQLQKWKLETKQMFKVNGDVVGTYKQYQQFVFATIYGAGHMVPTDQPAASYWMVNHFIKNDTKWE